MIRLKYESGFDTMINWPEFERMIGELGKPKHIGFRESFKYLYARFVFEFPNGDHVYRTNPWKHLGDNRTIVDFEIV